VRVSNAYGQGKLVIGAASVGLRDQGPAIVPGSARERTFGGSGAATVAAGAFVLSNAVQLDVPPLADLAVSLYLPGDIPPGFQSTGRYARQTHSLSPPGNFAAAITRPVGKLTDEWYFVSGLDVLASPETGGVVALGASLTDGNLSTHDAYCRWPDQLARRLIARQGGRPLGVMSQGLGGNRILHDVRGDSGLRRFDRDVLAQPGVTHVIVMLGTNDLRNRYAKPDEEVTAAQMIAGLHQMAVRAQARGIKFFGATLTPFGNETFLPGAWNPVREEHRVVLNQWIRNSGVLDGGVDFDKALRDPEQPTQTLPLYDCGDAIDLALFDEARACRWRASAASHGAA
jgi:lysophospholipase L1-like esterase